MDMQQDRQVIKAFIQLYGAEFVFRSWQSLSWSI